MSSQTVTATSTARETFIRRMKLVKFPLFIIGGVICAAWLVSLATPDYSDTRFAPNNPNPQGARALAQVLKNNDVNITFTRDLPEAVA